jgi:FtsP/CotA-like multicopper oxidase with cupredoxin domain
MMYSHHLSQSSREEAHQHIVLPLLPVTTHSLAANLSPTLDLVKKIYSDSLNCAKCHLSPESQPVPSQSYYEAAQHADLAEPKELRSENGLLNITLRVGISRSRGPLSFNTRTYNGAIPGPTLRVKAGDRLVIRVENTLEEQLQAPSQSNFYRLPNTTNLHLHGLWVAPHDVFSGVDPGRERLYEYEIPAEHAAGTNWYHPHFHGSSSLQLANGLAGMLIVDDEPTPPSKERSPVVSMKEHVMVLQQVPVYSYEQLDVLCTTDNSTGVSNCHDLDGAGSLLTMRSLSGDQLPLQLEVTDPRAGSLGPGGGSNYFTVNGDFQPRLATKPGEWRRLRLLNAAHQSSLSLSLSGCEARVIAMDGVYLRAPRVKNASAPLGE